MKISLRKVFKRFIIILVPLILLISIGGILLYYRDLEIERHNTRINETANIVHQQQVINADFQSVVSDLIFISKQNELLDMFQDEEHMEHVAQDWLVMCRTKKIYDQIRFLDEKGMEIVRSSTPASVRSALKEAVAIVLTKNDKKGNWQYFNLIYL